MLLGVSDQIDGLPLPLPPSGPVPFVRSFLVILSDLASLLFHGILSREIPHGPTPWSQSVTLLVIHGEGPMLGYN